jgi:mono/diheme cytochrome c family protein
MHMKRRLIPMHKRSMLFLLLLVASLAVAACGGGGGEPAAKEEPAAQPQPVAAAGDAIKGKELFATSCSACHGPAGEGVQGLGKDMTTSDFVAGLSDAELLAFIKQGRPIGDSLNTTGVDMPPKGGNPALTDEQLTDIVAFMRSIHK